MSTTPPNFDDLIPRPGIILSPEDVEQLVGLLTDPLTNDTTMYTVTPDGQQFLQQYAPIFAHEDFQRRLAAGDPAALAIAQAVQRIQER